MAGKDNRLQIEFAVIGGILLAPETVGETLASVSIEHFSGEQTRKVYQAIADLHLSGAPVDAVTVREKTGAVSEEAIRAALNAAPIPSAMDYYRELLRKTSQLSRLQAEGLAIASSDTLEDAIGHVGALNDLTVSTDRVKIVDAAQAAQAFYDRQTAQKKPEYIRFGFKRLDDMVYLQTGDFVVIGGYSSSGKTMLSLQMAATLAKRYRVGYFSLETNEDKLTDRLISHLSRVPLRKIKDRDFSDADWLAISAAATEMSALHLDFIPVSDIMVQDIQAIALNQRYQVVFVDYLQLASAPGKSLYEQVTNVSKGLHTLSRSHNALVIALAQLRRPDKEKGKPKPPTLQDFRESGQIEQDADVALLLYPEDINNNRSNRIMKVAKNKEGEKAQLTLQFDGAIQTFAECGNDHQFMRELQAAGRAAKAKPYYQTAFTEMDDDDEDTPF